MTRTDTSTMLNSTPILRHTAPGAVLTYEAVDPTTGRVLGVIVEHGDEWAVLGTDNPGARYPTPDAAAQSLR